MSLDSHVEIHDILQALGVFGLCQLVAFTQYLRSNLSKEHFELVVRTVVMMMGMVMVAGMGIAAALGSEFLEEEW